MSPEDYSEFMVLAMTHVAAQLNQIRRGLAGRGELDAKPGGDQVSSDLAQLRKLASGDELDGELAQLASAAIRLLGRMP